MFNQLLGTLLNALFGILGTDRVEFSILGKRIILEREFVQENEPIIGLGDE